MLYRYTLTFNLDEVDPDKTEKLKGAIKNEAEWIGTNVNVKVEDEYCIQANKKRLIAPIITTLDTTTFSNEKNIYLSSAKLLLENLKSIDENHKNYDDYHSALILAINCLVEKGGQVEIAKNENSKGDAENAHE